MIGRVSGPRWNLFLTGYGGTPTYLPQPISDQPVGLGIPHSGAVLTLGITVFVPVSTAL